MKVIGGPIVRRVEPTQAYIWIAFDSKPDSLDAVVKLENGRRVATCDEASKKSVQLGDNLFIALLKLLPNTARFPIKRKLYYDILINGQGLTQYVPGIIYPSEKLPSFFLPEKHQNILHGSCRKPHGGEKDKPYRDLMLKGDSLVNKTVNSLEQRPSMLFLTGDQIYADDVATSLLVELVKQGKYLTGWDEILPPKERAPTIPAKLKLCKRSKVLDESIGFSSSKSDNHLMSFGEYMAMYLVSWGGLKVKLPSYDEVKDRILKARPGNKKRGPMYRVIKKPEYENERTRVAAYLKSASKVRRLMANVPTYMIFDDHEVTDDWNLTQDLQDKLQNVALSRRVVSNALAAYWACQGWGNNPDEFSMGFVGTLRSFLTSKSVDNGERYETALHKRYWGYNIDGYPATIVLDTRTHRHFEGNAMPQLMNKGRLDHVKNTILNYKDLYAGEEDAQSIIIVSPTPVYGFKALEIGQLTLGSAMPSTFDAECWVGNKTGISNLENVLSNVFTQHCLILSGDVHYGLNRMKILQPTGNEEDVNIFQLTSSSLCNAPGKGERKFIKTLEGLTLSKLKVFNRFNSHYLKPKGQKKDNFLTGHTNIGLLQFDAGIPTGYKLFIHNNDSNKYLTWEYDLQNPEIVHY